MSSNWRIYFVLFLIMALTLFVGGRMFYLQIVKSGYYSALSRGQHSSDMESTPLRGEIFFQDRFNEVSVAAANKEWFLLYAVPGEIEDPEIVVSKLTSLFEEEGLPADLSPEAKLNLAEAESDSAEAQRAKEEALEGVGEIYNKVKDKDDPYVPIINKLAGHIAEKVRALELDGIYTRKEKLRYYPADELASHVLGFLGYEGGERAGQYGVEGFYDEEYLRRGKSLSLSIDYNIQFVLAEKLKEARENLEAESASGIVMDPATGEILALAVLDEFDPNNYSNVETIDIFLNDITQKMFEPGSVFKPFVLAAALDIGRISPRTIYEDRGEVKIGGYTIRNSDGKSYGEQTMTNVLELSLNTGAVHAQEILGQDKFREYIKRFGFKKRTGVDLQGEIGGDIQNILYTSRDINFATASFGQGIALTPLQLISAFSAFANGGKILKPHVVKEIIGRDGSRKSIDSEVIAAPISSKTAAQMTAMLVSVVENGWGNKAKVPGYKIAGKTGTAQVPKEGGKGYSEKAIHSFIGYAPAYNPRFLALIKLDNPRGINFSADSVAPLFSEIAEYILNYYEIPPE